MTRRTRIVDEDASIKATVLDYANSNPLAVRLTDTNGDAASGGDGAIVDGVSTSIKASVLDYTNSNPLAVRLTDTAGDYVGAGAGTQYTEDAAAAADPTGTVPILVRKDTPAGVASADGDNVAQRGTNYGAAYVQVVSSAGAFVDTFGGGTQYTEGDTDATITGTAMMMEGAANTLVAAPGTATDGLLVNLGANNDVTVTGTVTANAGTGTMAVSAASLPLPSGASTAAKQPALGTAGTASADVLTVQGIAAMTALKVDGSGVTQPVSGTVTANLAAGSSNIGDVDVLTVPADPFGANADAASATGSISAKLRFIAGTGIPITGTVTVGSHAVTNAGTFATQAAQSGTWTVQPGNTANTTPWLVTDTVATSGGLTMHKTTSAASTNATSVKASAGQVYSVQAFNVNAAVRYLKLYNKASAPTVGTDAPVKTLAIPGNTAGAGFVINWDKGLAFGTGIAFALTTEATDAGTTGVAANEITINIDYK